MVDATNIQDRLNRIVCEDGLRDWRFSPSPHLVRRPAVQDPHRSRFVVPGTIDVELPLDARLGPREHGQSAPPFQGLEEPFDLAIDSFRIPASVDVADLEPVLHDLSESGPELAPVVRDEELGLAEGPGGFANQSQHVLRRGRIPKDAQGQRLSVEAIDDSHDVEAHDQEVEGGQVQVPGIVDGLGPEGVERRPFFAFRLRYLRGCRGLGFLLAEHALDRASADLDAEAHDHQGDGPGAHERLGTQGSDGMHEPADGIRDLFERHLAEDAAEVPTVPQLPLPGPDGIVVNLVTGAAFLLESPWRCMSVRIS